MSEIDLKQQEGTEPAAETAAPRRRRRSEKYAEESRLEERRVPEEPGQQQESETAREVARRFRMEESGTTRVPMARDSQMNAAGSRGDQIRFSRGGEYREGQAGPVRNERGNARMMPPGGSSRAAMNGRWAGASGEHREHVGYAPGHMGMPAADRGRMSEESRARVAEESRARLGADPRYGRQTAQEEPKQRASGGRKLLTVLVLVLLVLGAVLIALQMIPEDAGGPLGSLKAAAASLFQRDRTAEPMVTGFLVSGQENALAPAEIAFSIATRGEAADVRMVDSEGRVIPTTRSVNQSEGGTLWNLTWQAEEAFQGELRLQLLTGESWQDTGRTVQLEILNPPAELAETAAPQTPQVTEIPVVFATAAPVENGEDPDSSADGEDGAKADLEETVLLEDDEEPPEEGGEPDEISEELTAEEPGEPENPGDAENSEDGVSLENEMDGGTDPAEESAAAEPDSGEIAAEPDPEEPAEMLADAGEGETDGNPPMDAGETSAGQLPEEEAPETAASLEPVATERPKLTVTAGEHANPSLISTVQIYNGTKKVREYARADREKVQMPTLGEYTRKQTGIFTFRTDAFRQNAAVGTVKGKDSLEVIWTAEAGSAKGAGQTYYGVGWTGQAAIVKWGKQVREASDMYDAKKEKSGLREVIVAGLDGYLYFFDLVDGAKTRNSIRLGFPMKGTPSVAPGGAPYMNVGQFARKMSNTTGTIGIRQYNLYNNKELSLIDGLDAKHNRALNKIGSFETSALISRVSDVMVTAGTNGLLYVVNLNPEFDYLAGVYQQSPTFVLLRSKAKNETDAQTAVEASVAMYDHYVYYADMGGYLRCVDTNSMTVSWAVALGDAVESTPALDWHGDSGLDLYCATEMRNRKKGDAEIRCIDALTGEERWSTGIGVQKDKKNKNVIAGFRASPVVGQQALSEYVYYTVNHLSDEGRTQLGLGGGETAALIALRKSDGGIVWAHGLSGMGYSSPVAVYDEAGNGSVIQCAGDGSITLLDGLTGEVSDVLQLDGAIEASPAVYNSIMVISTSEKKKNNIYGIRIQ